MPLVMDFCDQILLTWKSVNFKDDYIGVAAREFFTGINHKEKDIPANFIIQDLKNSDSTNFLNNLDHHLLPTQFSNQTPF